MNNYTGIYTSIFSDAELIKKIQQLLPRLFLMAELDNSRNGKLGMEIGSARERIIIALLMYKFGNKLVNPNLPITMAEIDVLVNDEPLSIKTVSGKHIGGIKLIWTVDSQKARLFALNYEPACDILLVHINWDDVGYLYLIPRDVQTNCLNKMGSDNYMKLPKPGTNPRGVKLSKDAINNLISSSETLRIPINFKRVISNLNAYDRWLEYWKEDI